MAFIFYLYPQVPVRSGARCPETTRKSEKRRREHAAAAFAGLKALNSPGNAETSSSRMPGRSAPCSYNAGKKCTKEGNVKKRKNTRTASRNTAELPVKVIFLKQRANGGRPYVIVKCQFKSVNTLQF